MLSRTLLRFFWTTFVETAVFCFVAFNRLSATYSCLVVDNHIVKMIDNDPWPISFLFTHGSGDENKQGYISTPCPKEVANCISVN